MFLKIFSFEIQNRLRRPALYIYFLAALVFTTGSFATGTLPVGDKENINAPYLIAFWSAAISIMMMLVSSSIMGSAIYRDLEYNTKDYYLTYPVTKPGYFWGRFCSAFVCMIGVALAIPVGVWLGTHLGPVMGWKESKEYGPNLLWYYLHPFLSLVLPNLFFPSALFFGLVAVTRNIKVIYMGGLCLFLGYFLSLFFLSHTNNQTVINLSDPFGINAVRFATNQANSFEKNHHVFPIEGSFVINRLLWSGVGLGILLITYGRFDFERFFAGRRTGRLPAPDDSRRPVWKPKTAPTVFDASYRRRTMFTLVRLELQNIARDNYFWMILLLGMGFLGFVFWTGEVQYGVPDLPRSVILFAIYNDSFPFFLFFLIMFYTGEILHRDRLTRYAFINDALPPPNWILNGSKLISLLLLSLLLAMVPAIVVFVVQIAKGFYQFHPGVYATYVFVLIIPRFLAMAIFCYAIHVLVNNKFAAHGVGILLWVIIALLRTSGTFDYNLWLYAQTPSFGVSDMDGIGHMKGPVTWFNVYWLCFAGLLVIISALFYYRGVAFGFRERWRLAMQRMDRRTSLWAILVLLLFIPVAGYVYYNVSYLNDFLTRGERTQRAVLFEKGLKKYQPMPLPTLSALRIDLSLHPEDQSQSTHAFATLVNRTTQMIPEILVDAGELTNLRLAAGGHPLRYASPLLYPRGKFNWFRSPVDTAEYRLYQLPVSLPPGDSITLEIYSTVSFDGFPNMMYAGTNLRNGTFSNAGLPGLGYDEGEELNDPADRRKFGLPVKPDIEISQDDSVGRRTTRSGPGTDLFRLDMIVRTAPDQTAVAPGHLDSSWTDQQGRRCFHYRCDQPGLYMPFAVASARWESFHSTATPDHPVSFDLYFHPEHRRNVERIARPYVEGLAYFSKAFGQFSRDAMRMVEGSQFIPRGLSVTGLDAQPEYHLWNAGFTDSSQFDYIYFDGAKSLAAQWWRYTVTPNNTVGSMDVSEGLSTYSALALESQRMPPLKLKSLLQDQLWVYLFMRRRMEEKEHPLLFANTGLVWGGKAGVELFGLGNLLGQDSLNAVLHAFKDKYAFVSPGPYPGANDLYAFLQEHLPDSLQYYLKDGWEKVTLYDNHVISLESTPVGNGDFRVKMTVSVGKSWMDAHGDDQPVKEMNDLIDVGIYGNGPDSASTRQRDKILYFKKMRFTAGEHVLDIVVHGKPIWAGIDPLALLVDRAPHDNNKEF